MKTLYDTTTQVLVPYPRSDDEDVVGLDSRYLILTVTQDSQPSIAEGESLTATENIDLESLTVTRGWQINSAPSPIDYKVWFNVQQFMAEFTMEEMAVIALSTDPTIAALRLQLTTWFSTIESNDIRVVTGLNKLVELGILSEERKNEIIAIT